MNRLFAALFAVVLLLPIAAFAQAPGSNAVTAKGNLVPGNCVNAANKTQIQDAGVSCSGGGSGNGVGVQGGQSVSNVGDNATALPAAHYVYATNANMTAARSHNLPDSTTQGVGDIEIIDAQQTVTSTNTLTVAAAGTNTLNGVTNGTQVIYAAGGSLRLHNDGAGAWTLVSSNTTPTLNNGQIYVGNASNQPAASTPGTGVITAIGANLSAAGGLTTTVAGGTSALGTGAISSAACATVVTTSATNTATTDVVLASFNGDPTAVTGYIPLTAGMLTIISYPTANNVNFKVCNNTSGSITPGAITLNWRVVR